MKKNILIVAICALVAFGFMSCNPEPTKKELLTTDKGWNLTKATCNPPYQLEAGVDISDLFDGFIRDYEKDDIMFFKPDGAQYLDYGKVKSATQTEKGETLGKWTLNEEGTELKFYLPYYDELVTGIITVLNETNLTVGVKINEDDGPNPTKTVRKYDFTLTYTRK